VVIDFSSWCTNFRWEFSQNVFRDLDDLFGFNMVYQYTILKYITYLFHLTSVLLFHDRFGPFEQFTDPYPSRRWIYGPEAWQEGLRQIGWTLITIMLIHLTAETCNTTALVKETTKWCSWKFRPCFIWSDTIRLSAHTWTTLLMFWLSMPMGPESKLSH